ncbi:MAG: hypothetical protein V4598_18020 [Bdellovibrionota bacterium]
MIETENTPIILNLAGVLSEDLSKYFASRGIRVIDSLVENALLSWTHILVKDLDNFDAVGDTYGTLENNIRLISLSQPGDLKNFMMNNGKLVLDESWLTNAFGTFLMDKFFQEYGGVTLSDNYPKFRELGSFNITNPFSTGEYLDHLVFNAFENGMSALSVKTYFDHILMYLTSLKNKGRVGFPIEVSYGTFNDVYGLQMHFFAENMQIEDVTNSLTSRITKTPEEYLLYVSLHSSDFFDFTYLPEVKKVVITALWNKSEKVKTENKGMMFTHAVSSSSRQLPAPDVSAPFVLNEGGIEDLSSFVTPAGESEVEIIPAAMIEEEFVTTISGSAPEEETVTTVSGSDEEEEVSTTVKGSKEEEDKTVTKISGKKDEKDGFKVTLSSSKEEKKGNMTVKSFGTEEAKGPGMFDFSNKGTVKDGTGDTSGNKKAVPLFNVSGPSSREKELEKKINEIITQNDQLKSKLVTVTSELKVQRDTHAKMERIKEEVAKVVDNDTEPSKLDQILRQSASKVPTERESKMAEEFRQMEKLTRKLQLESSQKEMHLGKEIEKQQRIAALKETMVEKTRETYSKALEKKDQEIAMMQSRLEQANKHMVGGGAQAQTTQIKELERQAVNQTKMVEMYKAKITNLAAALDAQKSDENSKDEMRKIQLLNDQMKTQVEMTRKEVTKLQDRATADMTQLMALKQEKVKLSEALKKAEQTARLSQGSAGPQQGEMEVKRLQGQVQLLETYLKESNTKVKDLEIKLQNAVSVNRNTTAAEDGQSKVKINHLENSVKKLTQDIVESRNQLAEMKKETNKLRAEKTALQNMMDKAKKDLEKYEKKPASGKKSA